MAIGNMQYGKGNDSVGDPTTLTSTAAAGTIDVENTSPGGAAIVGKGAEGHGVFGTSNGCAFPEGCYAGAGVQGENTGGGHGVRGFASGVGVGGYSSSQSPGVNGESGLGDGVNGTSGQRNGVQGVSRSVSASGVYGQNFSGGGYGIAGRSNARTEPFGAAVLGDNTAGGYAGYFNGRVHVNGVLSKSGGGFLIDNPVDPANKILCHSLVESPDMMNIYNGNVTTDNDGKAVVELPGYFDALNRDYRYQLTVVGQFAQAIVAKEIKNNQFVIGTDAPNVRVSWQVTGIRHDAWANAHRSNAEIDKPETERGKYLTPEEHGEPTTASLFHVQFPSPNEVHAGLERKE
jgi:hypothetical protein